MIKQIGSIIIAFFLLVGSFVFVNGFDHFEIRKNEKVETKTVWMDAKNYHIIANEVRYYYTSQGKAWDYYENEVKINGNDINEMIQSTIDTLNMKGYHVISITELSSARWRSSNNGTGGYSYTDGVIITAEKRITSYRLHFE